MLRLGSHLGFTGTREGLTERQTIALEELLTDRIERHKFRFLHHGVCIGGDAKAHRIGRATGFLMILHPPLDARFMADILDGPDITWLEPADYLQRNRAIVDATGELVAAPAGPERTHSGTWSTIRYARRQRRPVTVLWPDGTAQRLPIWGYPA
jgi:hypothetical protein